MLILDRMLVGGIKWVLGKIAAAVDEQMNDAEGLREQLLAAQMRLELGEISEEEFAKTEREVLARIRELQERRGGGQPLSPLDGKLTGVEATFGGDDERGE